MPQIVLTYEPAAGLQMHLQACPVGLAEMLLYGALKQVEREMIAIRLGAPPPSGLLVAHTLPPNGGV